MPRYIDRRSAVRAGSWSLPAIATAAVVPTASASSTRYFSASQLYSLQPALGSGPGGTFEFTGANQVCFDITANVPAGQFPAASLEFSLNGTGLSISPATPIPLNGSSQQCVAVSRTDASPGEGDLTATITVPSLAKDANTLSITGAVKF